MSERAATAARDAAVTPDDVERAARNIAGLVRDTPTLPAGALSRSFGAPVVLKAESLQLTGSFKIRGATNAILGLSEEQRRAGVVAASAGNHAQAVALAAARIGAHATLCMPLGAPLAKLEAVRQYGGEVRLVPGSYDEAQDAAREEGKTLVHAFDDPVVVAGQGTVGLEIARDVPDARVIVVPLGGGGLISGVAIAAKAALPDVRVVGVQAEACAPYPESLAAHRPMGARSARTIADGVAIKRPAELTLALVERYVDEVVCLSDDEIAQAMVYLLERSKLVVEGAGATAVAAILHGYVKPPADGRCCAVLSGGNVDASLLVECIRMGETAAGRRTVFKTVVPDRPGALSGLLRVVADKGANIVDVAHLREGVDLHVRETMIRVVVQTNGREHAAAIAEAMRDEGFAIEIES
jgi:threonine dehydratase